MVKKYYILFLINIAIPCAVCYGPIEGPISQGVNNAIFFMLGTIGFILLSIIGTIIYFYHRSKTLN